MIAYDTIHESWWWSRVSSEIGEDIFDIQKIEQEFKNLWIVWSQDFFTSIGKDRDLSRQFMSDLATTLRNPSEAKRLELVYVTWSQRISITDTDGEKREITFREILWLTPEEQKDISDNQMNDTQFAEWEKFQNWLVSLKNQRGDMTVVDSANIQKKIEHFSVLDVLVNQNKSELIAKDNQLKSIIDGIKNTEGIKTPNLEYLKKDAQVIPELRWISLEEIQSSEKYDNIILADYFEKNASRLSNEIKNPTERAKFENGITNLRLMLGRPVPFESLTKNIWLGPNRERVESRGQALIERWYGRNVVWNAENRTITFTNKLWEQYVLDTALIPPRERVVKHGLSIGQEIPEESEVMREFQSKKVWLQSERENSKKKATEISKALPNWNLLTDLDPNGENPIIHKSKEMGTDSLIQQRMDLYVSLSHETLTESKKKDIIDQLIRINLDLKSKNLNQVMWEHDGIDVSPVNTRLETEYETLRSLHTELMKMIRLSEDIDKNERQKPIIRDGFESIARENLDFLISLGYDTIWQATLDRVITALNREYRGHIDNSDFISLGSQTLQDTQKKALLIWLTRLMRTSGRWLMPEWDTVNNNDYEIAYHQTRSPLWRESLVSLWKREEYNKLLAYPDITGFQDRIIWRIKPDWQKVGT